MTKGMPAMSEGGSLAIHDAKSLINLWSYMGKLQFSARRVPVAVLQQNNK